MLKKIIPPILSLFVLSSCSKNEVPAPNGGGSGGSGGSGTVLSDPARYVLLSGREDNPADGKEMMVLRCFNPDLTLRWKKTGLGTIASGLGSLSSIMPEAAYANNVVYFVADSVFNIGTNYFTYNLFFAFDISSGTQLWKRRGTTDIIQNPIVKNDTIYCNYLSNGINYVAAYNPVNGTEFWKKSIAEKWGADRLIAEGTMLYYLSIQTNRDVIVNGFDLTTRTVKWQRNIGITTSIAYSDMALDGNQLFVRGPNGYLSAINKITGTVNWTKPAYLAPICANNKVYSYNYDYKIYSLDPATGNVITQFNPNLGVGTTPFVDGTTLYVSSATPGTPNSTYFIASYNAETGAEKWRKDVGVYYDGPVVAGSKIYAINSLAASNPTLYTLKSFNVNSGAVIDSTTITGNRTGRFMIINTADKRIVATRE